MTQERTVDSREHQQDFMLAHKWTLHSWALLLWCHSDFGVSETLEKSYSTVKTQRSNNIQPRCQYMIWVAVWHHLGSWKPPQKPMCCRLLVPWEALWGSDGTFGKGGLGEGGISGWGGRKILEGDCIVYVPSLFPSSLGEWFALLCSVTGPNQWL